MLATLLAGVLISGCTSVSIDLPYYLQSARGLSPFRCGLVFLALSAGAGTAARELRMLHARCYFAWCKREKVIYPGEREARLAPEGAYRGQYHAHPYGEFNMVVPLAPDAALNGPNGWCAGGWTAPAPGSHHYPESKGGPVIALFFCAQRAFVEGVTLTGVKG